jgi:hypothetical protein
MLTGIYSPRTILRRRSNAIHYGLGASPIPPEVLILKPSQARRQMLFTIGALFTVVGIVLIFYPGTPHRGFGRLITDVFGPSGVGWVTTVFFGACAITSAIQMLPNASSLELSPAGFLVCSLFRKRFTRWQDVGEFGVYSVGAARFVGFNYAEGRSRGRIGRQASALASGFEAAVPDTYGMTAEELADLMTRRLERPQPDQSS